ncbi:mRNA export factor [Anaeramoeba flamelloides]|uniref:mRNA export factor n=1 Tax=Anaeramoeba flamelloides TaxID=1746091 RepID=A0AAV8AKQ0_9EUKA|nr:mRNA export factor [Anaeramoeba flamelloides]
MSLFGNNVFSNDENTRGKTTLPNCEEFEDVPNDTISKIKFSNNNEFVGCCSWDGQVKFWKKTDTKKSVFNFDFNTPVFSFCWRNDDKKIFTADANCSVGMIDIETGNITDVGNHEKPVNEVFDLSRIHNNLVVSGSWDKTIIFWDIRQSSPVEILGLEAEVQTMDVKGDLMVAGLQDQKVLTYDLKEITSSFSVTRTPLHTPLRCISIFQEMNGYYLGSYGGRCRVEYFDKNNSFQFKCHRFQEMIYPVHAIAVHPVKGSFATVGGDNKVNFWCKNTRRRLYNPKAFENAVTSCDFSTDGALLAFGIGDDWTKGHQYRNRLEQRTRMCLMTMQENQI